MAIIKIDLNSLNEEIDKIQKIKDSFDNIVRDLEDASEEFNNLGLEGKISDEARENYLYGINVSREINKEFSNNLAFLKKIYQEYRDMENDIQESVGSN